MMNIKKISFAKKPKIYPNPSLLLPFTYLQVVSVTTTALKEEGQDQLF